MSDLGKEGFDGATLAIETFNSNGGLKGKDIGLILGDDKQNTDTAKSLVKQFSNNKKIAAIIGPMTSSMASAIVDIADSAKILIMSPTVSTNQLSGKDDFFFRVYPTNIKIGERLAKHIKSKGIGHVTAILDMNNRSYCETFYSSFKSSYEQGKTDTIDSVNFYSSNSLSFIPLAQKLQSRKSGCVLLLCNTMDAAMICQQMAKINFHPLLICGEWSVTEDITQYGGASVNGLTFYHTFNRNDTTRSFITFKDSFKNRFGYEPGFASTHTYNATNTILTSIRIDHDKTHLRNTILSVKRFEGVTGPLTFDKYGDTEGCFYLSQISDGKVTIIDKVSTR